MASAALSEPLVEESLSLPMHRFTVEQYEHMIRTGVLTENDRVELLEGWIVDKMPQHPLHAGTTSTLRRILDEMLPENWIVRVQQPISAPDSQPEPDLAVVRGPEERYFPRHPGSGDIALVVEVADSTLAVDRLRKARVYASARVPYYWIVNLVSSRVEAFSAPRPGRSANYRQRDEYTTEFGVPLHVGGKRLGHVIVGDLFPKA